MSQCRVPTVMVQYGVSRLKLLVAAICPCVSSFIFDDADLPKALWDDYSRSL